MELQRSPTSAVIFRFARRATFLPSRLHGGRDALFEGGEPLAQVADQLLPALQRVRDVLPREFAFADQDVEDVGSAVCRDGKGSVGLSFQAVLLCGSESIGKSAIRLLARPYTLAECACSRGPGSRRRLAAD